MLQKTFGIYSDDYGSGALFIEAGLQHLAAWCKQPGTGKVLAFEFFRFDVDDSSSIDAILRDIRLQSKLMDIAGGPLQLTWETRDALCVPASYYSEELAGPYLDLAMGEDDAAVQQASRVNEHVVLSRLPAGYIAALANQFKNAEGTHKFARLLKTYFKVSPGGNPKTAVYTVFYPNHFILTVINDDVLQIIRCVPYNTSEDVLYTIKQVCGQYNMAAGATPVIASGLIDTASNLYNTLYSYLENFTLEEANATLFSECFSEYPPHYFLPFIYE